MRNNDCPAISDLKRFVSGEMDPASKQRVIAHIGSCSDCETKVREFKDHIGIDSPDKATGVFSDESLIADGTVTRISEEPSPLDTVHRSVLDSLKDVVDDLPQVVLRDPISDQEELVVLPNSLEVPRTESSTRYQLQGEIARGGMGVVLRARDKDLGRDLVIKVLAEKHKNNPNVIQRFLEEAQIGGQLQHPGIAPLYELGQFSDGRPFFSMKLIKGDTLASLLLKRRDVFDERAKFLGIFEQICQTVAYAHSRGVVHRDLKPANIMVGTFGEVQVMDWGLAKVILAGGVSDEQKLNNETELEFLIETRRSRTETEFQSGSDSGGSAGSIETNFGTALGTPAYMAPEQALGEVDKMDERSDVFGLGSILCEILTGYPPYVGKKVRRVLRLAKAADLEGCFTRLDECGSDDKLIQLTKQCLSVDRRQRPQDGNALNDQVSEYLESIETQLRDAQIQKVKDTERVAGERRRARLIVALAGSVLFMVCLGGAGWLYFERQEAANQRGIAQIQQRFAQDMLALAERQDQQRAKAEAAQKIAEMRRKEAKEKQEIAEQIALFLGGVLEKAGQIATPGTLKLDGETIQVAGNLQINPADLLRSAKSEIKNTMLDQPAVRAALLNHIGNVFLNMREPHEAEALIKEAMEVRASIFGSESLEVASSLDSLGLIHTLKGSWQDADVFYKRALRIRKQKLPKEHPLISETLFHLSQSQMMAGDLAGAETNLQECVELRRNLSSEAPELMAEPLLFLAQIQFELNKADEGMALLREMNKNLKKAGHGNYPKILSHFIDAKTNEKSGNSKLALENYEAMYQAASELLDFGSDASSLGLLHFSRFLSEQGSMTRGIEVFQQALDIRYLPGWTNSPLFGRRMLELARAQQRSGNSNQSLISAQKGLEVFRNPKTPRGFLNDYARCLHLAAKLLKEKNEPDQSRQLFEEGLSLLLSQDRAGKRVILMARDYAVLLHESNGSDVPLSFLKHQSWVQNPDTNVLFAEIWCQSAKWLNEGGNPHLPLIREFILKRGVEGLRKAMENGFGNPQAFKEIEAFAVLFDRNDFRSLVAD